MFFLNITPNLNWFLNELFLGFKYFGLCPTNDISNVDRDNVFRIYYWSFFNILFVQVMYYILITN